MSQENEEPQAAGGATVPQKVYVPTNIPFPAKQDIRGNLATNWRHFKRVWENYEIATGLKDKDDELRVATVLTCIGRDALSVYDSLKFQNDEDRKNIIKVLQVLEDFCIGLRTVFFFRDKIVLGIRDNHTRKKTVTRKGVRSTKMCGYL